MTDHPSKLASSPSPESERPVPPRFYWLKRIVIAWIAMALLAAGIWHALDRVADRRLAAFIAAAHARGEPIEFNDFAPRSIPPERNAAISLNQAVGVVALTPAEMMFANTFVPKLPLSSADRSSLAKSLPAHSTELALVRAARGKSDAEWGHRFIHPIPFTMLPWANKDRELAELIQWSALYHAAGGDNGAALSEVGDMLMLANAVDRDLPCLVMHMVALGIHERCAETAIQIASHLRAENAGGAKRAEVEALIRQLLGDAPLQEGLRRVCLGERMSILDYPPGMAGLVRPRFVFWRPGPIMKLRAVRDAAELSRYADLATSPNWPAARQSFAPSIDAIDSNPVQALARGDVPVPGLWTYPDRGILRQYRVIAERRIAAIALAARLYAIDHEGHLPMSLNELVPRYLPTDVPLDPFRGDDGALSYLPDHDPPVVYSVGYNGTDEGGSTKRVLRGSYMMDEWDKQDAVYPLLPARSGSLSTSPATSPSQQAQHNDGNQQHK